MISDQLTHSIQKVVLASAYLVIFTSQKRNLGINVSILVVAFIIVNNRKGAYIFVEFACGQS